MIDEVKLPSQSLGDTPLTLTFTSLVLVGVLGSPVDEEFSVVPLTDLEVGGGRFGTMWKSVSGISVGLMALRRPE